MPKLQHSAGLISEHLWKNLKEKKSEKRRNLQEKKNKLNWIKLN